jgi:hypothetical protein
MARLKGSITRSPGIGNARYRMWQAMRLMMAPTFTIGQLMTIAEVDRDGALHYVRSLVSFGYLRIERPRISGVRGGAALYALIRNTGPHAPRIGRHGLFDPNLKIFVQRPGAEAQPNAA